MPSGRRRRSRASRSTIRTTRSYPDGRIAPVSRLAKKFFDAIENGGAAQPDFAAGFRVQQLIDAAQRSHREGKMIATTAREMPA